MEEKLGSILSTEQSVTSSESEQGGQSGQIMHAAERQRTIMEEQNLLKLLVQCNDKFPSPSLVDTEQGRWKRLSSYSEPLAKKRHKNPMDMSFLLNFY